MTARSASAIALIARRRRGDAGFKEQVEAGLNAGGGKNGRRTGQESQDTRRRFVFERKLERRRMSKPALRENTATPKSVAIMGFGSAHRVGMARARKTLRSGEEIVN